MRYIIYCRKSTDTEDKQVLSLDSQEKELLAIADKHNLKIVKNFRESMSAKSAGRPIFNQMMKMITTSKADAILCWKLDRLARNFVDGGVVMDSLQKGIIKEIRTYESLHLPNETSFILAMQFGMANQYSRDLSVNVKRGNREKLARGEWPNHAPFGYLNNKVDKSIIVDPIRSQYLIRAFELYATGNYGFTGIANVLFEEGLRTRSGQKIYRGHIHRFISNPFYCGLMLRDGKYYQGKHPALISKELFDQAQFVANNRNRPRLQKKFFPLRGFLKCDNCGCALTASLKKGHHYYYCTNSKGICDEHKSYMRENYLYETISQVLESLHIPEKKIEIMYKAAKERVGADSLYTAQALDNLRTLVVALSNKEKKLLNAFLNEQTGKELYDTTVLELQNERVSLNQKIREFELRQPASTLEPIKSIFLQGSRATKTFLDSNEMKKRKIISNLLWNLSIKNKTVAQVRFKTPFDILAKASKTSDISTLLPDLESNQD
jgi:site-specific DNA recombinase